MTTVLSRKVFLTKALEERALKVAIFAFARLAVQVRRQLPKNAVIVLAVLGWGMDNIAREKARRQGYDQVMTPDRWLCEQQRQNKRTVADTKPS